MYRVMGLTAGQRAAFLNMMRSRFLIGIFHKPKCQKQSTKAGNVKLRTDLQKRVTKAGNVRVKWRTFTVKIWVVIIWRKFCW